MSDTDELDPVEFDEVLQEISVCEERLKSLKKRLEQVVF